MVKLDLRTLGFCRVQSGRKGRPAYGPAHLLKLCLYGYFQRIRFSRRLKAKCQRNSEVIWLWVACVKVIADFCKGNGSFSATCRTFSCRW